MITDTVKIGDSVVFHTGYYGTEQGQFSPTWWAQDKDGVVVAVGVDEKKKVLVEFGDGERTWCRLTQLDKRGVRV